MCSEELGVLYTFIWKSFERVLTLLSTTDIFNSFMFIVEYV